MGERRRRVSRAVLVGASVLALAGGLTLIGGPARRYPDLSRAGPPSGAPPPGFVATTVEGAGGHRLRAFVRAGPEMVYWMDGNDPAPLAAGAAHAAAVLPDDVGITVIAPRGFEQDGGHLAPGVLRADAEAIRARVLADADGPVVFGGFSLGTLFTLFAAHRAPDVCAVLLAPLTDIGVRPAAGPGVLTRLWSRVYAPRYDARGVRLMGPALAVRGALDEDSTADDLAALSAQGPDVEVMQVPKVGHATLPDAPAVQKAVQTFVAKCRERHTKGGS